MLGNDNWSSTSDICNRTSDNTNIDSSRHNDVILVSYFLESERKTVRLVVVSTGTSLD